MDSSFADIINILSKNKNMQKAPEIICEKKEENKINKEDDKNEDYSDIKLFFDDNDNDNNNEEEEEENYEEENVEEESEDENNVENDNEEENRENIYEIPDLLLGEDIIGIDLGTTNTCVSILHDTCATIIPDEFGNKLIPSYVAYTNVNRYIGHDAKKQKDINIKNVFYEVKRLIGRKIDDKYVKKERELLSYDIASDDNGNILLKPETKNDKYFTPEEISASILSKAKQIASDYLKKKITKCVITVPAHFNDGQRQATKDAAIIAGLECIRIINEPTAAALAYGLLERTKMGKNKLKKVLVYDFGGGTLDVSVLNIENGIFSVLGSSGNMRLGGSDFDTCLIEFCIKKFAKSNSDFTLENLSAMSLQKLRTSCETAKQLLSTVYETHIAVKNFYDTRDLYFKITRKDFENLCSDLFLLCIKPVNDVLKAINLSSCEIDEIILVGGMTRMPKIRDLLKIKLQKEPNCSINPDEAVAVGAAIQGYLLSHSDNPFSESITLLDATSLSLGVETIGGVMNNIIDRGETIPVTKKKNYTTDKDYVKNVKIKVYEGERTLTKDNFLVGEFILNGLNPQPRGTHEIEVMFNIDANSIITVTATNKKTNTKQSMFITSNKGRLTQNQINQLIEESLEFEFRDEFEKKKKWSHYEIEDLCSNITINMKNKNVKLTECDKEVIKVDIANIIVWLKEKKYSEREQPEYDEMIDKIRKKYSVLSIKNKNENEDNNINATDDNTVVSTNIYDDELEKDKEQIFVQNEEDELGLEGMTDNDKQNIKDLRKNLVDMCNSLLEFTYDENINIKKEHIDELRDYLDDVLLWVHIHNKIKKEEYIEKINDVNSNCNKIFENYSQEGVYKNNEISIFEKLEQLCYAVQIIISEQKNLSCSNIGEIKNCIEDNLNWIYSDNNKSVEECQNRFDVMSRLSDSVFSSGIINNDIKFSDNNGYNNNKCSDSDEEECIEDSGISIISIMKNKKKLEMEKMIVEN